MMRELIWATCWLILGTGLVPAFAQPAKTLIENSEFKMMVRM